MTVPLVTAMTASLLVGVLVIFVSSLVSLFLSGGTVKHAASFAQTAVRSLSASLSAFLKQLVSLSTRFASLMKQAFGGVVGQVQQIGAFTSRYLNVMRKGVLQNAVQAFETMFSRCGSFAEELTRFLAQQAANIAAQASQLAIDVFSRLFSLIGGTITAGISYTEEVVNVSVAFLEDLWTKIQDYFTQLLDSSIGWVLGLLQNIQAFVTEVGAWIANAANVVIGGLLFVANKIWDAVRAPFCLFCQLCAWLPFCSRPSPCFSFC